MKKTEVIFIYKEPRFTPGQLRTLADIGIAGGQLFFASEVLPFIFPALDKDKLPMILFGLIAGLVCWTGSILVSRKAL